MPRTRCPECDADVVVDPRGRCPEGHLVTPSAAPVASRDQVSEGLAELNALEELFGRSEPGAVPTPEPAAPDAELASVDTELAHFEDLFSSIAAEDRGAGAAASETSDDPTVPPAVSPPPASSDTATTGEPVAQGPGAEVEAPTTPPVTPADEVASGPVPAPTPPPPGAQPRIDLANFTASGRRVEPSRPGSRRRRSRR